MTRKSAPDCNQSALNACFMKHNRKFGDLGNYGHIAKKGAVDGEGMATLCELLSDVVTIQPCAEIKHGQLKAGAINTAKACPKVAL